VALVGLGLPVVGYTTATQLENRDAFCASCHTEPEETYYQQTQESGYENVADLHAGEGVRCVDCHSGAGTTSRTISLSQGAQDLAAYVSGSYADPAVTTKPIEDGSCNECHADMLPYSGEPEDGSGMDGHYHAWVGDWRAQTGNDLARCVACHQAHDEFEPPDGIGFMSFSRTKAICDMCHSEMED
jgi:hypothetical protein